SAAFVPGAEALVYTSYTSGSALRSDVSGPGYWVFAPAQVASGGLVVVNRGFVPEGRQDPAARAAGRTAGRAYLVRLLRWAEARRAFSPKDDSQHLVRARSGCDCGRQELGRGRAVLHRIGKPPAIRRAPTPRRAQGQPAQRASAICHYLVWARFGCSGDVRVLVQRASRTHGMSRVRAPCLWKARRPTMF